ncbi:hypothetical protein [Actinophytocola sp.]|uniref:hypothetical protein n=1 Tax=Actinophytocola sp. TaxID=1872138 RepID=UPI002D7ED42E|nr:hypothetical protein [Actinophytocola sp.]HET9137792.1 hypothetical protein [Actinophytocola sp.]
MVGTGTAVAAALPAGPAAADPVFTGDVVLGAIPVTFVGAPLNNRGSTSWQVTRQRTDTFRLSATADQTLSLSFETSVSGTAFGVGVSGSSGQSFRQTTSVSVANAATIRSTETITLTSQAPLGSDGYARPGDTTFYLIARPKLNLSGNPGQGFRFKFLNAEFILIANLNQLLTDPSTRNPIGPATADAIAALYPFRDGNTSGLALPRQKYKFRKTISAGPSTSPVQFVNSLESGSTISAGITETFAVTIMQSIGFNNNADPATSARLQQTFGVGQTFQVSENATQERTDVTILTTSGQLFNDRPRRLNNVYKVKAFKTLIISDEGTTSAGQLVASGRVLDSAGNPVGGVVGLLDGTTSIEGASDPATGNYSLYSPTPLAPGSYPVVCGDATLTVPLGGSATLRPTPGTEQQPINAVLVE